jgi:hypothetical protein
MNTKHDARETSVSNEELALRLAKLELRVAVHDEILTFLKTVLDQLNESRFRLVLTKDQRARLNRWLRDHETNPKSGFSRFDLN